MPIFSNYLIKLCFFLVWVISFVLLVYEAAILSLEAENPNGVDHPICGS